METTPPSPSPEKSPAQSPPDVSLTPLGTGDLAYISYAAETLTPEEFADLYTERAAFLITAHQDNPEAAEVIARLAQL